MNISPYIKNTVKINWGITYIKIAIAFILQSLRLSNSSVVKCTTGKIVNLISNDINR